ncbi:MAG: hypothetical protein WAM60_04650 [Candidatus Promineifilaceae bacterium]
MQIKRENIIKSGKRTALVYKNSFWPFTILQKYLGAIALAFSILLIPAGSTLLSPISSLTNVPTIDIASVEPDQSVTIHTENFPANKEFKVTMGPIGTKGINGIVVGTISSGMGGSFDAAFSIPAALVGSPQISIRLQTSELNPYYSFNWFYNISSGTSSGTGGSSGYSGIPTITITSVVRNEDIVFQTENFPANQTFNVYMGPMGTRGIGGVMVGRFPSGDGGSFPVMVPIPDSLMNSDLIAVRAQTEQIYPYYSYNYFYNTTTP